MYAALPEQMPAGFASQGQKQPSMVRPEHRYQTFLTVKSTDVSSRQPLSFDETGPTLRPSIPATHDHAVQPPDAPTVRLPPANVQSTIARLRLQASAQSGGQNRRRTKEPLARTGLVSTASSIVFQ